MVIWTPSAPAPPKSYWLTKTHRSTFVPLVLKRAWAYLKWPRLNGDTKRRRARGRPQRNSQQTAATRARGLRWISWQPWSSTAKPGSATSRRSTETPSAPPSRRTANASWFSAHREWARPPSSGDTFATDLWRNTTPRPRISSGSCFVSAERPTKLTSWTRPGKEISQRSGGCLSSPVRILAQ